MSFNKKVSETCKASHFNIRALRHIQSPHWGFQDGRCSDSRIETRLLRSPCWHICFKLGLLKIHLLVSLPKKSQFCRITSVLADLHWLPVRHRINFKIDTIAFKVLHFQQPSYLAALFPRYVPMRTAVFFFLINMHSFTINCNAKGQFFVICCLGHSGRNL